VKLIIAISAFFFILCSSSFANVEKRGFSLNANCYLNGGSNAVCEACNFQYNRVIRCSMQIRGMSSRGFWFNGYQNAIVYPGQCMNGYVYANNPYVDPLVDSQARVNCSF